ncbi:MAG TPA: Uma2 family endonuclease [Bacteroidetes bacterium]|nr:Uma2 family endonuclease [Bacteroidota bacterium]
MAETTLHFRWIVKIKENLETLTADKDIFVAGDLLWYPVQGHTNICKAPDVMVVIGRPKGDRLSYLQWHEENTPPQVVFEIYSKSNRRRMNKENLLKFYEKYGVEEFYSYDPVKNIFVVHVRHGDKLAPLEGLQKWVSPLLNIRFEWNEERFEIYHPNGRHFISFEELERKNRYLTMEYQEVQQLRLQERKRLVEVEKRADLEKQKAEIAEQKAKAEKQKAETERQRAEAEKQKAETERRKAEAEKQKAETERQRAEAEKQKAETERRKAEAEKQRAEAERRKAEAERQRAEAERQRAEAAEKSKKLLAKKLKELGIDPETVS